jgi:hypothetical protein
MPVDIKGYVLSDATGGSLKLGTANDTQIFAANYGVRDNRLPAMNGAATAGGAYKVYPFPVNNCNVNIGSGWSNATGMFTCPVAGLYYTSWAFIAGDGSATQTAGYYSIIVNGVMRYHSYRDTIAYWELQHLEMILKCAAGDTIAWASNAAPGPASGTAGGAYQGGYNTSVIFLIG